MTAGEFFDPAVGVNVPPGMILRMELERRGLSQAQLALRTGLSTKTVNQIVQGTAVLSPDTALRFEKALGVPSLVWNQLEAAYQDAEARERSHRSLADHADWLRKFPVAELENRGVVDRKADAADQVGQLLSFFQVADPEAYHRVWSGPVAAGFRRARHLEADEYATALWLRLGERAASASPLVGYDADLFTSALPQLRPLTRLEDANEALKELERICAGAGVGVAYVPEVAGSRVCGAARWPTSSRPVIILSGRYKYADSFWFSFFHEAAHILLHPKREVYVHTDGPSDNVDGLEDEADRFAARTLIGNVALRQLKPKMTFAQIRTLAAEADVAEGIIAGQLCHRFGEWQRLSKLRRRIELSV